MDLDFDINSIIAGVLCSAIAYVFGGIFKLRIDINHAFKKIRQLEKRNEDASSIRENLSEDAGKNAN